MSIIQDHVNFAVVGCGHIGKRHAEMIVRHPEAQLVALCDVAPYDALALNAYEVPFYGHRGFTGGGLGHRCGCICTPNGLHAPLSIHALEARKHVVCEKPMALTKADCETVIFKAMQVSRQVFCVMQNRYSPPSVWIKEVIDQRVLGDIFMVQTNCYWNRDGRYYKPGGWKGTAELDGGTLFTQFSHFVDIMYWLFGDIANINAQLRDFAHQHSTDFEDSGMVTFDFVNGGMGCLNYSTAVWDQNMESSMTIVGSRGSIKIGGQYMNEVEYLSRRSL